MTDLTEAEKLPDCPFCGSGALLENEVWESVDCLNCTARAQRCDWVRRA